MGFPNNLEDPVGSMQDGCIVLTMFLFSCNVVVFSYVSLFSKVTIFLLFAGCTLPSHASEMDSYIHLPNKSKQKNK